LRNFTFCVSSLVKRYPGSEVDLSALENNPAYFFNPRCNLAIFHHSEPGLVKFGAGLVDFKM